MIDAYVADEATEEYAVEMQTRAGGWESRKETGICGKDVQTINNS
jgi:hypothetical protein